MTERNYRMDNIRFLLIFLVIFGHFLELMGGEIVSNLYRVIYAFHMPAFIFITGHFARFSRRKIVFSLIYPYVLFQTLYLVYDALILNDGQAIQLQFTTPYWLLWYLLATIFYYLFIPLLDYKQPGIQTAVIIISVIVSLLMGYDPKIGYHMSLSRFFTFLPFFVAGYYTARHEQIQKFFEGNKSSVKWCIRTLSAAAVAISCLYVWKTPAITPKILYGASSYEAAGYEPKTKIILLIISACWIIFLMTAVPNKKLCFISAFGKSTLFVFLFHGFFIRLVRKYFVFECVTVKSVFLGGG